MGGTPIGGKSRTPGDLFLSLNGRMKSLYARLRGALAGTGPVEEAVPIAINDEARARKARIAPAIVHPASA